MVLFRDPGSRGDVAWMREERSSAKERRQVYRANGAGFEPGIKKPTRMVGL